ncbi:hypothetical protein CRP01_20335 [Flavilitoribacter nigricans DSM 23189 = NBRC 102662]|uniref:Uncharacterized protein n=1 Tax=Flavilitoribacter nigricans (strain ATCC 23147 / DSM 23189 / NBRC 102662 / NCIMB 1420 / SS-2) TaxID=1122177 RepID=A0A2D0N8Q1_FLAN2|nr:hypothetical protein CRP01_20335 [Flavilitoribacter nigricans DSM 23189 = NBRC 102662]
MITGLRDPECWDGKSAAPHPAATDNFTGDLQLLILRQRNFGRPSYLCANNYSSFFDLSIVEYTGKVAGYGTGLIWAIEY